MQISIIMEFDIKESGQSCGAEISSIDLKKDLTNSQVNMLRNLWLKYHVLSFPNQLLNDDDLERFCYLK